ncbi:MAG: hypothetical protein ACRCXB_18520 [Aeromonadaceae bacterium]
MNAQSIIEAIASNIQGQVELSEVKAVLEDGEALGCLGVEDCDQEFVEEAHNIICERIESGEVYL